MSFNRRIWVFIIVLWVFIWTVFAVELAHPEPGISPSIIYYSVVAPVLVAIGLWWIKKGKDL